MPDEDQLYFRPTDPPPAKLSAAELIMKRLDQMPNRQDLWRAALLGMLGGSPLTTVLALAFVYH